MLELDVIMKNSWIFSDTC